MEHQDGKDDPHPYETQAATVMDKTQDPGCALCMEVDTSVYRAMGRPTACGDWHHPRTSFVGKCTGYLEAQTKSITQG